MRTLAFKSTKSVVAMCGGGCSLDVCGDRFVMDGPWLRHSRQQDSTSSRWRPDLRFGPVVVPWRVLWSHVHMAPGSPHHRGADTPTIWHTVRPLGGPLGPTLGPTLGPGHV